MRLILSLPVLLAGVMGCEAGSPSPEQVGEPAQAQVASDERLRSDPAEAGANYVEARITTYSSLEPDPVDRRLETRTRTVAEPETVDRLASHFPGMGEGRESDIGGGWIRFAEIRFVRPDGGADDLSISLGLGAWAEGDGERPVARAGEFRRLFMDLMRDKRSTGDDAGAAEDGDASPASPASRQAEASFPAELRALKDRYAGPLRFGNVGSDPRPAEAMERLTGEWDPVGLTREEVVFVLGKPTREDHRSLEYRIEDGYTGTAWVFRLDDGRRVTAVEVVAIN